ncbi:hypothetical protein BBJ28_00017535 [Nothophytophthora sp. Chile5]|nr:hypothetical protein BBJ28_00017535 [Nothophytophthora sp. Chile5]
MAAVSMHGAENAFGGMNSGLNRRLSPAFRTLASPLRRRHCDLEKLRELARSDEFSDSESDGVGSDDDDDDLDVADTMFVPYRRPSPQRKADRALLAQRRLQKKNKMKKQEAQQQSSPKGDEWEIVDKSPTFESVVEGSTELGGESWFVQESDHQ